MPTLVLPESFPLPEMVKEISPADTDYGPSSGHYLAVGLSALDLVETAFVASGSPRSILDLPCGYGRIARVLRARYPEAALTVCDPDRAAVEFCAGAFVARGVVLPSEWSELRLGECFDLLWVGSLLTHLPAHAIRRLLDVACRHMDASSRLVVTTHGPHSVGRFRSDQYGLGLAASRGVTADYLQAGFGFRGYDGRDTHGVSLIDPRWLETLLAGTPLRIESYHPQGWDRHQDVFVLRRVTTEASNYEASGLTMPAPVPSILQDTADASSFPGFDERWYLRTYADVDAAVRRGESASALEHFLACGWGEGRLPYDPSASYAKRTPPRDDAWVEGKAATRLVEQAWFVAPEQQAAEGGDYWMAHPSVRARANRLVTGDADIDPYAHLARLLQARGWSMPVPRAVSLGCGFGGLERDLVMRGLVREFDAFDLAAGAIVRARREAASLGLSSSIRYHVADLERFELAPGSVDIVFAHSSVHHVERLEALYAAIRRALRPNGIFHLHEFVGPTRFQWTDAQLDLANGFLDRLPARLRALPGGQPRPPVIRPTVQQMMEADPSESVRSAELVALLEPCFEIIEHRRMGGAVLHLALGGIAQNFDPAAAEDEAILADAFALEDDAMARRVISSDFAVITATPKPTSH